MQNNKKESLTRAIDWSFLFTILAIFAIRSSYLETPTIRSTASAEMFDGNIPSLLFSSFLFISPLLWILCRSIINNLEFRLPLLSLPVVLFIISIFASCFWASDKRIAINASLTLSAIISSFFLLIQLITTRRRLFFTLILIPSLCVMHLWEITSQKFSTNQITMQMYQENPSLQLEALGIEQGSLEQWQYEHRIKSQDVKAYFTTSNSESSFLVMGFFIVLGILIEIIRNGSKRDIPLALWPSAIILALISIGLYLCFSKGAIVATVIGLTVYLVYILKPDIFKRLGFWLFPVCIIAFIGFACFIIIYCINSEKLPGGNSLLVRSQYWNSTIKMLQDNPKGVGSSNFALFYPQYKDPAALETVSDPHNWILSILSQYGPYALGSFALLIIMSIANSISWLDKFHPDSLPPTCRPVTGMFIFRLSIIISIVLLIVRPILVNVPLGNRLDVKMYVIFVCYVMPVIFLCGGLWTLSRNKDKKLGDYFTASLICGIVAVLIHNLLDFAIFEPAVFTALFICIALLISLTAIRHSRKPKAIHNPIFVAIPSFMFLCVLILGLNIYVITPSIATAKTIKYRLKNPNSNPDILLQTLHLDTLDPLPLSMYGKIKLNQYIYNKNASEIFLKDAYDNLILAVKRNPQDYSLYRDISRLFFLASERATNNKDKYELLEKSLTYSDKALDRYPGKAILHIQHALIFEGLSDPDEALAHYIIAVEIEDSFRKMFKKMYGEDKSFSRLPIEKYNYAKERIKRLSN